MAVGLGLGGVWGEVGCGVVEWVEWRVKYGIWDDLGWGEVWGCGVELGVGWRWSRDM